MNLIERHEEALEKICASNNITLECILTLKRTPDLKPARIECFCYLRNLWNPYWSIAQAFWYKSHATVMVAIKKHCPYVTKLHNVNTY